MYHIDTSSISIVEDLKIPWLLQVNTLLQSFAHVRQILVNVHRQKMVIGRGQL